MIIGRTKSTSEKSFYPNLLTKKRYYEISKLVRKFILENNITSLPIALNTLVKNNKWKVYKYSKVGEIATEEEIEVMKTDIGFAKLNEKTKEYSIYYDDSLSPETQRFTVAHEIGHIIMKHFNIKPENSEQEANMFAARLLMPLCVLYELKISSHDNISKLCFVSETSAKYRYNRFLEVIKRDKFYTDPLEILVYKQFENFIIQKKLNEKGPL